MEIAYKQLIEEHNGILYKIGRSYTQTDWDFEDLYQEMLIQLWKAFPNFQGKAKVSTWLYRVCLNTAITFSKKTKKLRTTSIDQTHRQLADPEFSARKEKNDWSERIQLLYTCIQKIPKDDRAIIFLHLEGASYDEISEIIGMTKNHVGVKILRIKKKLFQLLNENGYARI